MGSTDEGLLKQLDYLNGLSYQDRIVEIARTRALVFIAEEMGASVDDDEVRAQIAEEEQRAIAAMARNKDIEVACTTIQEEMLAALNVSKAELNETYLYVQNKNLALQFKAFGNLYEEKVREYKQKDEKVDEQTIIDRIYEEALKKYKFTILVVDEPQAGDVK